MTPTVPKFQGTSVEVRFSVVIPTYNRAQLIGRAVSSALDQTRNPMEVIVVDDGSTDDTLRVLQSLGPRVRCIEQSHGGPSRARNTGVMQAAGDWIAFLDSDDVWAGDYLTKMADAIQSTGGAAGLYFSDATWNTGGIESTYWQLCAYAPSQDIDLILDPSDLVMGMNQPMLLPFSVFRKDAYEHAGGLWEELWSAEDTHLFLKMGLMYPACAVSGTGGSVTSDEVNAANRLTTMYDTGTVKRWAGMVLVYEDLLRRFPRLAKRHRKRLVERLAFSHWRLSRLRWLEGKRGLALRELWKCVHTEPAAIVGIGHDAFVRRMRSG
jgi:glycosyltransferase involved in cell wall biosynthesis